MLVSLASPASGSLPRDTVGSASALHVSRPARRSLALRPAWSPGRPRAACSIGVLQAMSLPPSPAPIATGWSDSCRAGFAPARGWRLSTAHRIACACVRAFASARFARLITHARGRHRTHVCRSFLRGFFRTGAKQETKQPADAASSCPILPQFSQGQPRSRNYICFHEQKSNSRSRSRSCYSAGNRRSVPQAARLGQGPAAVAPKRGPPHRHPFELFLQPERDRAPRQLDSHRTTVAPIASVLPYTYTESPITNTPLALPALYCCVY